MTSGGAITGSRSSAKRWPARKTRRLQGLVRLARASGFVPRSASMSPYRPVALLWLYPASFRAEYGGEMTRCLRKAVATAARPASAGGALSARGARRRAAQRAGHSTGTSCARTSAVRAARHSPRPPLSLTVDPRRGHRHRRDDGGVLAGGSRADQTAAVSRRRSAW